MATNNKPTDALLDFRKIITLAPLVFYKNLQCLPYQNFKPDAKAIEKVQVLFRNKYAEVLSSSSNKNDLISSTILDKVSTAFKNSFFEEFLTYSPEKACLTKDYTPDWKGNGLIKTSLEALEKNLDTISSATQKAETAIGKDKNQGLWQKIDGMKTAVDNSKTTATALKKLADTDVTSSNTPGSGAGCSDTSKSAITSKLNLLTNAESCLAQMMPLSKTILEKIESSSRNMVKAKELIDDSKTKSDDIKTDIENTVTNVPALQNPQNSMIVVNNVINSGLNISNADDIIKEVKKTFIEIKELKNSASTLCSKILFTDIAVLEAFTPVTNPTPTPPTITPAPTSEPTRTPTPEPSTNPSTRAVNENCFDTSHATLSLTAPKITDLKDLLDKASTGLSQLITAVSDGLDTAIASPGAATTSTGAVIDVAAAATLFQTKNLNNTASTFYQYVGQNILFNADAFKQYHYERLECIFSELKNILALHLQNHNYLKDILNCDNSELNLQCLSKISQLAYDSCYSAAKRIVTLDTACQEHVSLHNITADSPSDIAFQLHCSY